MWELDLNKAESRRTDAFELWCWGRLLIVLWTTRRSNQSILKEISPGCSLEGMMLKLKLQYFGHLVQRVDSLEKTLMLGGIGAGGEGDNRGWDGWMASPTRWMWVWVNSGFGDGQEGLACYSSWGCKESDTTEWLNWTDQVLHTVFLINYIVERFFIFGYDNTSFTKFWMFDIVR